MKDLRMLAINLKSAIQSPDSFKVFLGESVLQAFVIQHPKYFFKKKFHWLKFDQIDQMLAEQPRRAKSKSSLELDNIPIFPFELCTAFTQLGSGVQ